VVGDALAETRVGNSVAARVSRLARFGLQGAASSLVWQAGGVLNHLTAVGVDEQELARVAASI
jgi:hypothetical protein